MLAAVLADGMGGHAGGALASGLACKFFLHAFTSSSGDVPARLDEALILANAAIAKEVFENAALDGMGCTLIGVAFGPAGIEWVSVGDSPLFLVRKGEIVLLNEDHSLAPQIDELAAAGKISWEAAKADPRRHYLRSALTGGEMEMIDRSRRPLALQAGDVVILASDGIHTLAHAKILEVVEQSAAAGPDTIAEALIAAVAAAREPYQDNTTVVVVAARPD
jgi:protein phosphatase